MGEIQLWDHQREALSRTRGKKSYALFFEQGSGKTPTAVHIWRQKCEEEKRTLRVLVICPPIVIENWRREFLAHAPSLVSGDILTLSGPTKNRAKKLRGTPRHIVAVTNFEALLSDEVFSELNAAKYDVLIVDESHKAKDVTARRTKLLIKLAEEIDFRFILSGTPFPNSLADIFSQFLIMDLGETFGRNYFHFRNTYFVNLNAGKRVSFPNWQARPEATALINEAMYKSAMRVTKAECLDLPPLVRQFIDVEMTPEQTKFYRQLEKDWVAKIGDSTVSADLAITKAARLHHVTCGFVKADNGEIHRFEPNTRADALRELLLSIPKDAKVVIWAVYKTNYYDIERVLGSLHMKFVTVTGDTPAAQRQDLVDDFQKNSAVRALVGHPASVGIGVNLVAASYAIFYSRDFSLENDLQAEARNHRGGSEIHQKITRIDLCVPGTIDEVVLAALHDKQDVQAAVLKHIKQGDQPNERSDKTV